MPASFVSSSKQYLSLASTPSLSFASGSVLTVAAWVKLKDTSADYCILAKNQDSYSNGSYLLRYNADIDTFDWIVSDYTGSFTASVPQPTNTLTAASGV